MKFLDNSLSAMPVLVAKVTGMAQPPSTDPGFVRCRLQLRLAATAMPHRLQTRLPPEAETSDGVAAAWERNLTSSAFSHVHVFPKGKKFFCVGFFFIPLPPFQMN